MLWFPEHFLRVQSFSGVAWWRLVLQYTVRSVDWCGLWCSEWNRSKGILKGRGSPGALFVHHLFLIPAETSECTKCCFRGHKPWSSMHPLFLLQTRKNMRVCASVASGALVARNCCHEAIVLTRKWSLIGRGGVACNCAVRRRQQTNEACYENMTKFGAIEMAFALYGSACIRIGDWTVRLFTNARFSVHTNSWHSPQRKKWVEA